jgi:methionyl-tRNA formyltransferase
MALRIVFAGTPEFAVPSLRAAASRNEVVAVYTSLIDQRVAAGGLQASKIKLEAIQRGIPVLQPESR